MGYEKFTLKGRSFNPAVSILKSGQMIFNKASVAKFNMGEYGYASLFYDKERKKIGIKLLKNEESGARQISPNEGYIIIGVRFFLDYYQIDRTETIKYTPTWDEDEKMIVVDLLAKKS